MTDEQRGSDPTGTPHESATSKAVAEVHDDGGPDSNGPTVEGTEPPPSKPGVAVWRLVRKGWSHSPWARYATAALLGLLVGVMAIAMWTVPVLRSNLHVRRALTAEAELRTAREQVRVLESGLAEAETALVETRDNQNQSLEEIERVGSQVAAAQDRASQASSEAEVARDERD